jgi:YfiH family protein
MRAVVPGAAFTDAGDGDMRADPAARRLVSSRLGIDSEWATVTQVHGASVVRITASGDAGEADALFTDVPGLALAVFTADCLGVVVIGSGGVGVAHAGWRGAADGVVSSLIQEMEKAGLDPRFAYGGPAIGPCCFEVGPEVIARFPDEASSMTTWGTASVDLEASVRLQLGSVGFRPSGSCTRCDDGFFSHRRDTTPARLAAIGYVP